MLSRNYFLNKTFMIHVTTYVPYVSHLQNYICSMWSALYMFNVCSIYRTCWCSMFVPFNHVCSIYRTIYVQCFVQYMFNVCSFRFTFYLTMVYLQRCADEPAFRRAYYSYHEQLLLEAELHTAKALKHQKWMYHFWRVASGSELLPAEWVAELLRRVSGRLYYIWCSGHGLGQTMETTHMHHSFMRDWLDKRCVILEYIGHIILLKRYQEWCWICDSRMLKIWLIG